MRHLFQYQQRFIDAPSLLRARKRRQILRRAALLAALTTACVVGIQAGWSSGVGTTFILVGRALAGLAFLGFAGLMIGVSVTLLTIVVYNVILKGPVSLLDVDYIDEVPLIFVAVAGFIGIFISQQWSELFGLIGWGLVGIAAVETVFKRPQTEG